MLILSAMIAASGFQPPVPLRPERWVTDADYPPSLMTEGIQRVAKFRLVVSPEGSTKYCTITMSSGDDIFDALTCSLMMKRSKFSAARDRDGNTINSVFNSALTWKLPDRPAPDMSADIDLSVRELPKRLPKNPIIPLALLVSADGILEECLPKEDKKKLAVLGSVACQQAKARWKPPTLVDENQVPVRSVQTITVRFSSDSEKMRKR
ncbi:hypothetical protein BH11PSE5_BH11PSE5_01560 [soil metagenome]